MKTEPHQAAIRAAEKIAESFSVGTFAKTAELDFTPADPSDIAQIITREYEPVIEALRDLVAASELPPDVAPFRIQAAISRAKEVLQQPTKEEIKTPPVPPSP